MGILQIIFFDILFMDEILIVDCIVAHFCRIFSLPDTECLIMYPHMKCVNVSVMYTFYRLVCGRDLLMFNMSNTSGVGLSSYSAITIWVMVILLVMG